ncbi:hypothetical protein ALC53_02662 [Atta colombica]|uniref:Uncharacterized protein n=1 Tax=Atta colombica TaxID=520822 RepID=A0A195BQP8_9HYME|nr:hypothetical protein ALC53_02662 [Atta colombica]
MSGLHYCAVTTWTPYDCTTEADSADVKTRKWIDVSHLFVFQKDSASKAKQRNARQGGRGGGWAQLLLIVKRRIKKGEEKALGGWGWWVAGGQRKRREK